MTRFLHRAAIRFTFVQTQLTAVESAAVSTSNLGDTSDRGLGDLVEHRTIVGG